MMIINCLTGNCFIDLFGLSRTSWWDTYNIWLISTAIAHSIFASIHVSRTNLIFMIISISINNIGCVLSIKSNGFSWNFNQNHPTRHPLDVAIGKVWCKVSFRYSFLSCYTMNFKGMSVEFPRKYTTHTICWLCIQLTRWWWNFFLLLITLRRLTLAFLRRLVYLWAGADWQKKLFFSIFR